MSSERGSATPVGLAVALLLVLLGSAVGSVGQYVGARLQAATAADAAALAAAPVTFAPFGTEGGPAREAARFSAANGARLVRCECSPDPSWAPRVVEVEVARTATVMLFGDREVRAVSRAEFVPTRLFGGDVSGLLGDPRLELSPAARADLEAGRVDGRVVAVLSTLTRRHALAVSVLVTGHAKHVRGTDRVSHHFHGRAVDIWKVDGRPVSEAGDGARELVRWLASLEGPLRPDEVGSPFGEFDHLPGFFSDPDHRGHVHLGYRAFDR